MAGQSFLPGEQKIAPGIYVRTVNIGEPPIVTGAQGIAAALIKATWGPIGEVVTLEGLNEVTPRFGTGEGTEVLRELFRGGARRVLAVRVGTGGAVASLTLKDTEAADVVKLDTLYPTSRQIKVTIRETVDGNGKELLVYDGSTLLETIVFTKGSTEPENLTEAVTANSAYLKATKIADGNGVLEDVTDEALTGGTNPNVTGEDYVTGAEKIEAETWNIIVTDSETPAVHAAIKTFVDEMRNNGKRVMGIVGEPTSVNFSDRLSHASALNDPAIVYVGNGFVSSSGSTVQGANAAARIAGEILRSSYTYSLTHHVIANAVDVVGKLTNAQIEQAIQSGMLVFAQSAAGQVQVEYGITTFINPTPDLDEGWKKIRRVRTRDMLIDRVVQTLDPYIGRLNNSPDGRATVISVINGIIQQMIAEGGLLDGVAREDETIPPQGDAAWFVIEADDLDSLEKVYITFGFRFSPAA